jgi:hypothetical protein
MSIGEDKVISNLVKLGLYGDKSSGKINIFGGNIVRIPSEYIKRVLHNLNKNLSYIAPKNKTMKVSFSIQKELAMKSAFFFIGNIMLSKEWKEEVLPIIKNKDDWVLGAVSSLNSMGLGKWKIRELEPDKKLILDLYESNEASYYFENNLESEHPVCDLSNGLAIVIMALIYDTDITENDKLKIDFDLYKQCFNKDNSFSGKEVRCKALTKDYCEFIVERQS